MRSTYELQTSDFVELPRHFPQWFPWEVLQSQWSAVRMLIA